MAAERMKIAWMLSMGRCWARHLPRTTSLKGGDELGISTPTVQRGKSRLEAVESHTVNTGKLGV